MKKVVKVKLLPSPVQAAALAATLTLCNEQANRVSAVAHQRRVFKGYDLRAITYTDVRATGLSSQTAQQVIRKTTNAYKTLRANIRAGNYGPLGSCRREKVLATPIQFRPTAAQPYDDRILGWDHTARTVSIWVVDAGAGKPGRIIIPFTGHPEHLMQVAAHRKGETDLTVDRQGRWFLIPTLDLPHPDPTAPNGMVGVDMGIVNLATSSHTTPEGETVEGSTRNWSGGAVTFRRKKNQHMRRTLQKVGTKSAKRKLARRSGKEARFVTDTNHRISKQIVAEAKRTGRGIAVEDLTGIRARVRLRKPQRATFHSWAFAQLGQFITYKATEAGVPLLQVDPAYTSQECHLCGHIARNNRPTQALFTCQHCGLSLGADHNASINIARLGQMLWLAGSSQPAKSGPHPTASRDRDRKLSPSGLSS